MRTRLFPAKVRPQASSRSQAYTKSVSHFAFLLAAFLLQATAAAVNTRNTRKLGVTQDFVQGLHCEKTYQDLYFTIGTEPVTAFKVRTHDALVPSIREAIAAHECAMDFNSSALDTDPDKIRSIGRYVRMGGYGGFAIVGLDFCGDDYRSYLEVLAEGEPKKEDLDCLADQFYYRGDTIFNTLADRAKVLIPYGLVVVLPTLILSYILWLVNRETVAALAPIPEPVAVEHRNQAILDQLILEAEAGVCSTNATCPYAHLLEELHKFALQYRCPLDHQLMDNPYAASSGNTYSLHQFTHLLDLARGREVKCPQNPALTLTESLDWPRLKVLQVNELIKAKITKELQLFRASLDALKLSNADRTFESVAQTPSLRPA